MIERKKKILFLIHTLQVGGAEKVLIDLVNNLDKTKFDITVMTVINTGAFRNNLNSNIKYKTIINIPFLNKNSDKKGNKKSGNLLSNGSKIKKILANLYRMMWKFIDCSKIHKKYIGNMYDVEISFLEGIPAKIIAASNNKNSHKIAWIHVDLQEERKSEKFFRNAHNEKETYGKFDKIVGVSKVVAEQFINKFSYKETNKVIVIHNPIDVKNILEKSKEKVDDIQKNKFTLCTVGRLSVQKGYDRLLEIVDRINQEKIEFDLWIIGVGPEERKLKEYIENKKIKNVKLLGYKENPYKYIKKADLFVCSSRAEGFSTVVSEATVLEKPVIATECAGMKEIFGDNNEYGMVVDNTTEALYEGLRKLLIDKKLLDEYRKKIINRKDIFGLKKSVCAVEELFKN